MNSSDIFTNKKTDAYSSTKRQFTLIRALKQSRLEQLIGQDNCRQPVKLVDV